MAVGYAAIIFAALCGGAFAVPLKHRRKFAIENTYLIATFICMFAIPLAISMTLLPGWPRAMNRCGLDTTYLGFACGFGWGIGAITFGYGIMLAGLSLGYGIIMGVNTAVGSLLPFFAGSPRNAFTRGGLVVLLGVFGCVMGVLVCSYAGKLREGRALEGISPEHGGNNRSLFPGPFLLCIASGVLSACANVGFAFTSCITGELQKMGANPDIATLGSWLPVYWGAFLVNVLWFGGTQIRRGTWRNNVGADSERDWWLAALMGVLWFSGMMLYGVGAHHLGRWGTSVGWAVNIASSLLVANFIGILSGEWRDVPPKSVHRLFVGLGILVLSMTVLGLGNSMLSDVRQ